MATVMQLKQPPIIKLSLSIALCERFGYFILASMLVLFAKAEYSMTDATAFSLFTVSTALTFMTPAIGGYIADNIIGVRRGMIVGLVIEAFGFFMLAIPSYRLFPIALSLIIIGVGLFKTGPTNLLGRGYEEDDPRMDAGFTLYYMGMNLGAVIASVFAGVVQHFFGWHIAFLIAGLSITAGLAVYFMLRKYAIDLDSPVSHDKKSIRTWAIFGSVIILLCALFSFLIFHAAINNIFFGVIGFALIAHYLYEIMETSRQERLKIIACLTLMIIGLIYFILYYQLFTSMTLFIERVVDRNVFGMLIPTQTFLGLNPFWVLVLGPILTMAYKWIAKTYGSDLPLTAKFSIGLLAVSLSFLSLVLGDLFADSHYKIAAIWPVLAICLYTLGEMLVSALGFSVISKLVPKKMYGVTMGTWLFGCSVGSLLSGRVAALANIPEGMTDPHTIMTIYNRAFTKIGLTSLAFTALVIIVSPYIKRMADWK